MTWKVRRVLVVPRRAVASFDSRSDLEYLRGSGNMSELRKYLFVFFADFVTP